jgi:hypothetical protein
MRPLLKVIENGKIDPSFVITHRMRVAATPSSSDVERTSTVSSVIRRALVRTPARG